MTGMGMEGWRSGGSTCLPPLWPGFDSWMWHHMWVEFVVCSRLAPKVFLWVLQFSSLHENQHAKSQSTQKMRASGLSALLFSVTLTK